MIPDEAVEAVLAALKEHVDANECCARAALEAAVPHIRAQAFDEAASKLRNDMEVPQRIWVSRKVTALAMIERGDG